MCEWSWETRASIDLELRAKPPDWRSTPSGSTARHNPLVCNVEIEQHPAELVAFQLDEALRNTALISSISLLSVLGAKKMKKTTATVFSSPGASQLKCQRSGGVLKFIGMTWQHLPDPRPVLFALCNAARAN